jgi:hypothetical protein
MYLALLCELGSGQASQLACAVELGVSPVNNAPSAA